MPAELSPLLPLARIWGIEDDIGRAAKVKDASLEELRNMVDAVDATDEAILDGWLTGPESYSASPSEEYIAITCLTMAVDAARIRLSRAGEWPQKQQASVLV